ncbi:uncharacterized protein LOC116012877 [Ipomoea triloba]|uniref:uncharacterized protein LOC116012877 n=1 Tax=Ipomoea triloba TaxID=35885 RepID=UPI00125D7A4E|nr:uncharacterized protein LOC116012877 [Ipomoea triloba]
MDKDESQYFDFSRLTNRYTLEIQHQASREMVMIINNKIKPPGGEPIWSWYSRAEQLDYLKGFLKPLAVETKGTSKAKDPEDIIVLSDTEDEINRENIPVEKPLPLVSVKQEPIDDEHEKSSDPDKNLPLPVDVNPISAVSEELHTNETVSEPPTEPNPETTQTNLPQTESNPATTQTNLPQTEPSPGTTPTNLPTDESPKDFEIEFETGNVPEIQVADPADEEDNLPLSQVKRNKEKAKGKKKVQEEQADKNPVTKIQVFPVPATRRKTRSSTVTEQKKKETPSPVRKSKRKQPSAEQTIPQETTGSKKRKNTQAQQSESLPDVSVVAPLEVITLQFLSDEYGARWESTNQRKILSERYLDIEKFKSQCQLMPRSYPPIAIKEFYANLMKTIKEAGSQVYGRVWLRGKEYTFDTHTINLYLGIDASDIEDPVIGANTITKVITGGTYSYWPVETNMLPAKSLITKYAILHKIAMTNWMPNEHRGGLNLLMATLIYKI